MRISFCIAVVINLILFFFSKISAREIKDTSIFKYSFDTESRLFFQSNNEPDIPILADVVSNIYGSRVYNHTKNVTDNPFRHNAFYALLKNEISVFNKFKLNVDLLTEHRGMSYGLYDMDNVVIFPYYKFNFHEQFKPLGHELNILFKMGSFTSGKVHEGLKIYNVDYLGGSAIFTWKIFFYQYYQIGDLSYGIGLQLEEYMDHSFGIKFTGNNGNYLKSGINLSISNYAPSFLDSLLLKPFNIPTNNIGIYFYPNYGLWSEYKSREKNRIYFQYELRSIPYINISENSGLLLGGEFQFNYPKMSFVLNPEFRYYGWVYNFNHRNDSVSFRKKPSDTYNHYGNTVGRYLYPLMNYYNPFSQWAVYTDYQYQNIAGIELRLNLKRQVYKNLLFEVDAENCTLIKEYKNNGKKTFTYLFYSFQLAYNVGDFNIGIGLNNKSMNLDKHYQTFYMRKEPVIHYFIRKDLSLK